MSNPTGYIHDYITSFCFLDTNVFAGTTNSLLRSSLNDSTWTAVHKDNMYRSVYVLHTLGGDLFAGTMGGVYRSTDRGESWTDGNSGMKNAAVQALALEGTTLYAATWGGGVFRSSDRGNNWECSLKENAIFSLAFTKTRFYAGGWGMLYDSSRVSGVLNILSYPDTSNRVWSLAVSGTNVYAGTESGGLFQTWYDGQSWHCPRVGFKDTSVNCLLLDGADLYAGTAKGLYRSSDEGAHWTALNNGLTSQDVRALVFKGTDLFAGTAGGGVFRSTDKGVAWTPVNDSLSNKDVLCFAVKDDNLFAGTWEGGVFLSENNGATWKEVSHVSTVDPNFRIPGVVQALAVDGSFLYAGERRTGLWRRPFSEMVTSAGQQIGQIPFAFALWQNFPNPFNPSTTIRYDLPARSAVRLSVFNLLGQEVAVLAQEEMEAGRHDATFDALNLASGVYYCQLQARQIEGGLFLQTRKMLLLH